VSVVIPALNEAKNLPWVLGRLPLSVDEVILVDGHSTDDTVAVARSRHAKVRVVAQRRRGKGAALITGLLAAQGDICVMLDADGSMDPVEIPALVGALLAGADVAKASRYVTGGGSDDLTVLRSLGNRALTCLGRLLFRQRWSELCYGMAAFWTDRLPLLRLAELLDEPGVELGPEQELAALTSDTASRREPIRYGHGFEIEAIIFTRATRSGLRVTEVASWEHCRQHGTSNLNTFRDGWRVLRALARERLRRIPATATDASWVSSMLLAVPDQPGDRRRAEAS
jgi:glycosyltransferase involved in cell wall biosynthesis